MKFSSMRSVYIAGSTVLMSVLSMSANAQTAVLNFNGAVSASDVSNSEVSSIFTFNKSMLLNSIGMLALGDSTDQGRYVAYKIGNASVWSVANYSDLNPTSENGVLYYTFANPIAVASGSTVTVVTAGGGAYRYRSNYTVNNLDVSHASNVEGWAGGNIKVTNPSANVAPEPATFALALTGGAALIGICIRRRRNAA
jgi:hypothetical protein